MNKDMVNDILIFLEDILSESIAPATYRVLSYHVERVLKRDMKDEVHEDPETVYNTLEDILGGKDVIEQLDLIVSSYLKNKYNITVPEDKVFRLLKESNLSYLHIIAKEYLSKRSVG